MIRGHAFGKLEADLSIWATTKSLVGYTNSLVNEKKNIDDNKYQIF